MAVYFNENFLTCSCGCKSLYLQEQMLIEDTSTAYLASKTKVLKCSKCNNIVKTLDKFNEKPIVEV